MKMVIQHSHAPLFWTVRRTWSCNPREAMVFLDEVRAQNHAYWHNLDEITRVTACKRNPAAKPSTPMSAQPASKSTRTRSQTARLSASAKSPKATPSRRSRTTPSDLSYRNLAPVQFAAVVARVDVGLGNALFIRGEGEGLSWGKGAPLECLDSSTWEWRAPMGSGPITFKLLLNDQVWAAGSDLSLGSGERIEVVPAFS